MAKRLVVYARELRDDDYSTLRQAWQETLVKEKRGHELKRRRINWPMLLLVAVGIVAAVGLFVLLVQ